MSINNSNYYHPNENTTFTQIKETKLHSYKEHFFHSDWSEKLFNRLLITQTHLIARLLRLNYYSLLTLITGTMELTWESH